MKKVNVKDLKIGDKVLKFDRSWLETDFLKHKFVIKNQAILNKIIANGIQYVYIEDAGPVVKKVEEIFNENEDVIQEVAEKAASNYIDVDDFNKASEIYSESVKIIGSVLDDIRAGKMFNDGAVKNVAENIAEITRRNRGVLASVTKLKKHDDYTFQHSMNVSIYAASLASHLGMSEQEVERIANAGLLHDVGKMLVPSKVLNKPGKLSDEEFIVMKNHVQFGYEYLKKQNIPADMLRLAYEHHERYDGSGYPNGLKDDQISIEGKIGAVVDIYDAITSDRVYHKGMEPPSALKLMFKWADSHINKKVFEFFVMNIGIYPVGSIVVMNTGDVGMVGKTNLNKPTEPVVLLFMNKKGEPYPVKSLDLSKSTINRHKIAAPINPTSVNVPAELYAYIDGLNKLG